MAHACNFPFEKLDFSVEQFWSVLVDWNKVFSTKSRALLHEAPTKNKPETAKVNAAFKALKTMRGEVVPKTTQNTILFRKFRWRFGANVFWIWNRTKHRTWNHSKICLLPSTKDGFQIKIRTIGYYLDNLGMAQ